MQNSGHKENNLEKVFFHFVLILAGSVIFSVFYQPYWNAATSLSHTIFELFCVMVALFAFLVIWYLYDKSTTTNYLLGFGFLSVAILDIFHTSTYPGLMIRDFNLAMNLSLFFWLLGRLTEASVILGASYLLIQGNHKPQKWISLVAFGGLPLVFGYFIYKIEYVPILFIEGTGLTLLKITSEWVIIFILLWALVRFWLIDTLKNSNMIMSLLFAIVAEGCFVFFDATTSFTVVLGHVLKIIHYYYLFLAIVIGTILKPYKDLERSKEHFYTIFNSSPVMMAITKENRILEANQAWHSITSYDNHELIGSSLQKYIKPMTEKRLASGNKIHLKTKRGELLTVLLSEQVLQLDSSSKLIVLFDITERERYEEELKRLDALNLSGQIAAGIGHEIRNPLTTVRGFMQLFKSKGEFNSYRDQVDLVISEVDRANGIITDFLSVAKPTASKLENVVLNDVILSLKPLIEVQAYKEDIEISIELGPPKKVPINVNEIKQVILNLANNGIQAMDKGKTLKLKTFLQEDCYVLSIIDEGVGIPNDLRSKIGTPFFTTKEHGVGLGLSISYKIIENHGANINFITNSKEGTTFNIFFPLAE